MIKLFENWRKFISEDFNLGMPSKDIEYTAYVLEPESQKKLLAFVPSGWKAHAHHMTIIPHVEMKQRLPARWLDWKDCITVIAIAENERVIAARVDIKDTPLPHKLSGLPHITIATNPATGGKPEMSNEFTEEDYKSLQDSIDLCGGVEEISRGS